MIASFRSTRKTFKNGNFYVSLCGELYATLTVSSTKNCTRSYSLRFPPIFSEKALARTEILCILQQCTNLHWSQLAQPLYHRFRGKSVDKNMPCQSDNITWKLRSLSGVLCLPKKRQPGTFDINHSVW